MPWEHWSGVGTSNTPVVVAGARLGKASSLMPFLKDEEQLALEEEGRLCSKKSILSKGRVRVMNSFGQNRAEGNSHRLGRWRVLPSDSKLLQGELCQGFELA